MLAQEPWVYRGQIRGLQGGDMQVIWDSSCEKPRACIILKRNLKYICLSEFLTGDLVAIQVSLEAGRSTREAVVASGYFPGDESRAPPEQVAKLTEYCEERALPLLLGCDANAHHEVWGSSDTNRRGEYLLEFILSNKLEIYNVGNTPTFVTSTRQEVLDITLGNTLMNGMVRNWRVSDEPSMSDHRIIRFDIEGNSEIKRIIRNPKRTDWESYTMHLSNNIAHLQGSGDIRSELELETVVEDLNTIVIDAYEASCPAKTVKSSRDVPWWNRNLARMRTEVRKLFNRAKQTGDWRRYKNALTAYSNAIREAKRNSFREFCEGIEQITEATRLYKAVAKDGGISSVCLKKEDGTFTENEEDRVHLLLRTHFPGSYPSAAGDNNLPDTPTTNKRGRKESWKLAKEVCSEARLRWAVGTFQPMKSPGVDGIFPALIQRGLGIILESLLRVVRGSIALGYIPRAWRRAKVVFIPKAGKKDPFHPKSFRPICLTSFVLKTVEKVIDNYIRTNVLKRNPLHHCQHAYRAGRSTETALYQLTEVLRDAIETKEIALCAFLDIEGAFDNTSHTEIQDALSRKGVGNTLALWMGKMLESRQIEVQTGTNSIIMNTTQGCPQGGVLSPLMWSMVVDELLDVLTNTGIQVQGYADDIVLICRGKYEDTLCDRIQTGLRVTSAWCRKVGLRINPTKTTIVPFTRRRKLDHLKAITLHDMEVKRETEVKYLGITLDQKLLWKTHVGNTCRKATRALMTCRSIAGKKWGCSPKILLWIYTAIVRPMITYGAVIWAERTQLSTQARELHKLQRLACVCISGAMRTCPTASLEVLLGLTPLHLHIQMQARRSIFRMAGSMSEAGSCLNRRKIDILSRRYPELLIPRDNMTTRFHFDKKFETRWSNKANWESVAATYGLNQQLITWYTDGSLTAEGAGAGVIGPRKMYFEPMGRYTSIFQAEIYAIDKCASFNLQRNYRGQNIAILTDSQAAIKALRSNQVNSKLVWECLERLNTLGSSNKVWILWVPGHAGLEGNEAADELAKKGAGMPLHGPEPFCGIGNGFMAMNLRNEEKRLRELYWAGLPGMEQSRVLIGGYEPMRTKDCLNLTKKNLRIIVGILTGHCRLNYHLGKLGISTDTACRCCEEEDETSITPPCY